MQASGGGGPVRFEHTEQAIAADEYVTLPTHLSTHNAPASFHVLVSVVGLSCLAVEYRKLSAASEHL